MSNEPEIPNVVDRMAFLAQLDALRPERRHIRTKAMRSQRRLPMVEIDPTTKLLNRNGPVKLLDAFEGRGQLIAYYFMWHTSHPAPEQCEGCTWVTTQIRELSCLHWRGVTFAVFCQGPYQEKRALPRVHGLGCALVLGARLISGGAAFRTETRNDVFMCYLRDRDKVFETYLTTQRGVEVMDNNYRLLDLTVYGRQEAWEDSLPGWPQRCALTRTKSGSPSWQPEWPGGRPFAQWPRVDAGRSDDLGNGSTEPV